LWDLANSCEYLTADKTCSAVIESQKSKANRQAQCRNDEKANCCYICQYRRECAVNCKFLGNVGNVPSPAETKKPEDESEVSNEEKIEAAQTENSQVTCCSSCNAEMSRTKTKFKVDGWSGADPKLVCDASEEFLPVIVYLCPRCGKIEFRADQDRADKNQ
jgi:hypothetical protein